MIYKYIHFTVLITVGLLLSTSSMASNNKTNTNNTKVIYKLDSTTKKVNMVYVKIDHLKSIDSSNFNKNKSKIAENKIKTHIIKHKDVVEPTKKEPSEIAKKYAPKVGLNPEDIKNESVYFFIDKWYGTRYVYGGTSKNGIDCSAFTREFYKTIYNKSIERTSIMQYRNCTPIFNSALLREGDLLFFNTLGGGVSHVAVYLSNGYFVHSASSTGVAISHLSNSYWSRKYIVGGRII